jgi:hypothetical protein
MDPTVVEFIGFIVASLILTWAAMELNRRYFRQRKVNVKPPNAWARFDSTHMDDAEVSLPGDPDDDQEDTPEPGIHTRAQQNGHHSESKKLL